MTMAVVGGLIPPKEVHLLIFTCGLMWERDFAGVTELRLLRWRDSLGHPGGPAVIIMVLISDRQESWHHQRVRDDGSAVAMNGGTALAAE